MVRDVTGMCFVLYSSGIGKDLIKISHICPYKHPCSLWWSCSWPQWARCREGIFGWSWVWYGCGGSIQSYNEWLGLMWCFGQLGLAPIAQKYQKVVKSIVLVHLLVQRVHMWWLMVPFKSGFGVIWTKTIWFLHSQWTLSLIHIWRCRRRLRCRSRWSPYP